MKTSPFALLPLFAFAMASGCAGESEDTAGDIGSDSDSGDETSNRDAVDEVDDGDASDASDPGDASDSLSDPTDATIDDDFGNLDDAETDTQTDAGPPRPGEPVAQIDAPGDSDALSALPDVGPFPAAVVSADSPFLNTRISVFLAANTDVAAVNAVLAAHSAEIASARPGDPFLSLEVPPLTDTSAALSLAAELVASGAFEMAMPAYAWLPQPVEVGSGGGKRLDGAGLVYWLELMRMYAAWNAADLLVDKTTVVVADTWASTAAHPDLSALRFDVRAVGTAGVSSDGTAFGNHGFWVAGLLGADVNGTGTSGTAFRAADSLDLLGVQVGGLSFPEILHTIESASPNTGNFVINTSFGYNDPEEANETRAARALYALQWRAALQRMGPERVLVVAAAGNDGLAAARPDASLSSPMTTQSLVADLSTLIAPEEQALWARVEARITELSNAKTVVGSTIVVGSSNESGNRLGFSTPGEDVLMPGFELTGPCVVNGGRCVDGEMTDNGTSGATPLASGIAAMIWSLNPDLAAPDVRALVLGARSNGAIDAYNTMWSSLGADASSPLPTLVDSNDDGAIDEVDITLLLGAWQASETLDPDPSIAPRDWSRFDLNGDGYSRTDTAVVLDLDGDGRVEVDSSAVDIGDVSVSFDENGIDDFDLLCLAAYGPFYAGDRGARDEALSERCSSDVPPPSPDAVWIGTVTSTTSVRSVGPTTPCPTFVETSLAEATFHVECNGAVPGLGGECSIVRSSATLTFDRTHASREQAGLYGSSSLCGGSGCGSGTCFEDPSCACAPAFCEEAGVCARARVSRIRDESYSGAGATLNIPSGILLRFGEATSGTVTGTISDIEFQGEAFGGVRFSAPAFSGDPTPEEREAELAVESPPPGTIPVSLFLGSGAGTRPLQFTGTSTETTITGTFSDTVNAFDSLIGSVSVAISLRRIR